MRNIFSYFKSKNDSKSQPLPLKRTNENVIDQIEPKTCPMKKRVECDSYNLDIEKDKENKEKLLLHPGDICIVWTEDKNLCFPVLVVDPNSSDAMQNKLPSYNKFPSKRYGSHDIIWIDVECDRFFKIIHSNEELMEYFKKCDDPIISSEFEEFIHLINLSNNERLEMFSSVELEDGSQFEEPTRCISRMGKKASFLNDSDEDNTGLDSIRSKDIRSKEDGDERIKAEESSANFGTTLLSKYTFQVDSEIDITNETAENQSLKELEKTIKILKSNNYSKNETSINYMDNDYQHHHLEFLNDKFRKDINGIPHYHQDADKTTLYVPQGFINSKEVTPVLRQWWKIKSEHFDTILLFKMGKFYETYHMDADIAVRELGLIYMRGTVAHAGFPESSFPLYASILVQRGYKVARVEQTETPQMMNDRIKTSSKSGIEKVVNRELCTIMTPGTRIFDSFDVEIDAKDAFTNTTNSQNVGFGMLAVIINSSAFTHTADQNEMGVCLLDSSTGQFHFSQFIDDHTLSQLRTMFSSMPLPVAEVIIPKKIISSHVQSFVSQSLSHARKEYTNEKIDSTVALLLLSSYFSTNKAPNDPNFDATSELFSALDISSDGLCDYHLALIAMAYCLKYLKKNKIDQRILSMKNFHKYVPKSSQLSSSPSHAAHITQRYMILDHNATTNLDIFCNDDEIFNKSGSLMGLLDHCCTPFGHRLLPGLISQPLYRREDIEERLCAVEAIMNWENKEEIRNQLRALPDLHRLFFRVHANGELLTHDSHPENRAMIFNASLFNKKKVNDLINALTGFDKLCEIVEMLQPLTEHSVLISDLCDAKHKTNCFHNTKKTVIYFQNAFNITEAKENGVIIPKPGVLIEYDKTINDINELQNWFELRLEEIKSQLSAPTLKYWSSGKIRYYIEAPQTFVNLPSNFIYKSQRKGFCRYALDELEEQNAVLIQLEEKRDKLISKSLGLLLKQLSSNKDHLLMAIHNISMIDCLFSFALFSNGIYNGSMCRPFIIDNDTMNPSPFIKIEQGYHPYLASITSEFVCNDFVLGDQTEKRTMIITGPNMGGKSTLMRQVAIIVILAQLGCYVPAVSCRLTPVDRIFARLGASFDKPCNGQSTFYVELLETSTLLNYATQNSLVVLDELGRGTATYDGMAIADAVLEYISTKIKCLLLFSTHYHNLVRDLVNSSFGANFKYYQMSFIIDDLEKFPDSNSIPRNNTIIFLYRLVKGVCSSSYGFHVAQLTGLPIDIIHSGTIQANMLERKFVAKCLLEALNESAPKNHVTNSNTQYCNIDVIIELFKNLISI